MVNDFDEFIDIVGTTPTESLPVCEKDDCEKRICSSENRAAYRYVLTCANCFEYYVVDKEEYEKVRRMILRANELWAHRLELRKKYGRNSKSYDSMEGYDHGI